MTITRSGEQLRDIKGLSEKLGVGVSTLYRWRSEGRPMPPSIRLGGLVRWRDSTIDAWIASQEEESA